MVVGGMFVPSLEGFATVNAINQTIINHISTRYLILLEIIESISIPLKLLTYSFFHVFYV